MRVEYADATLSLQVVALLAGILVALVAGIVVARSRVNREGATPIPILLASAVSVVAIALAHVLLGGQLSPQERQGLWAESTIIAFPTSMAAVGGTLITLWAVLWTAKSALRVSRVEVAESRRRRVTELKSILDQLDGDLAPIAEVWLSPEGDRGSATWQEIKARWTAIRDELSLRGSAEQIGSAADGDASLSNDGECANGHVMRLPEFSAFFPRDELIGNGCKHFLNLVSANVPFLYKSAIILAGNRRLTMNWVSRTIARVEPLLESYDIPLRPVLQDGLLFQKIYPAEPPDPKTATGRFELAVILGWVCLINTIDNDSWGNQFVASAAPDVRVLVVNQTTAERNWAFAKNARAARARLRKALIVRRQQTPQALSRGSEVDFWHAIVNEAGLEAADTFDTVPMDGEFSSHRRTS